MKRTKYIFASVLLATTLSSFALTGPALPSSSYVEDEPTISEEVSVPPVLNSAPEEPDNMSGEINITIPYNPNEVDKPTYWLPDEPRYINLNSATQVPSGPALNMFIALALSLLISGFVYKKMKPLTK